MPPKTTTQKKPVPATVRPQSNTGTKKPIPPAPKPQTAQRKKPVPSQVTPQTKARTTSSAVSRAPTKAPSTASKAPSQVGGLKAGQAVQSKPPAGQEEKAGNWISRMVQGQVQRVGDYAGGYVNNIGSTVNKFGEGIGGKVTDQARYLGQGVAGYGNDIKDSVAVGGTRVSTAGNPLGMAGQGSAKAKAPGDKGSGAKGSGGGTASNPLGIVNDLLPWEGYLLKRLQGMKPAVDLEDFEIEAGKQEIDLSEDHPRHVERLVEFLYTTKDDEFPDDGMTFLLHLDLCVLADKYDMPGLKDAATETCRLGIRSTTPSGWWTHWHKGICEVITQAYDAKAVTASTYNLLVEVFVKDRVLQT